VLPEALFYSFSFDRHAPINPFVNLSGPREHLQPYHSSIGHPSIDPELMIRMLIVDYCSVSVPSSVSAMRCDQEIMSAFCPGLLQSGQAAIGQPRHQNGTRAASFAGYECRRDASKYGTFVKKFCDTSLPATTRWLSMMQISPHLRIAISGYQPHRGRSATFLGYPEDDTQKQLKALIAGSGA